MATHSSILAWEIPWTEESMVGYPCSRGSQKVRHNLETKPKGFPGDSVGGESARSAGAPGSSPGPGGSSGEGNGNPLQYSCLENSTDRGAWWATVHGGHKEPDTTEQLTQHIRISDPISEHLFERIKIRISDRCPPWSPQGHSQQPDVETTSVPSADEGDEVHLVDTPQTLKTTTFCRVR